MGEMDFFEFIKRKTGHCPGCKKLLVRDWDIQKVKHCHHCGCEQESPYEEKS